MTPRLGWVAGRVLVVVLAVAAVLPGGVAAAADDTSVAGPGVSGSVVLPSGWSDRMPSVDAANVFAVPVSAVADLVAAGAGADPAVVRAEFAAAEPRKLVAVFAALSQVGVPYRRYTAKPGVGFDCSGLTSWAYGVAGIVTDHQSGAQIRAARRIGREELSPGDLVHYPGHVGMYVADGLYVHAPQPGRSVEVVPLPSRSLSFGDMSGLASSASPEPVFSRLSDL